MNALGQLDELVRENRYEEIAQTLSVRGFCACSAAAHWACAGRKAAIGVLQGADVRQAHIASMDTDPRAAGGDTSAPRRRLRPIVRPHALRRSALTNSISYIPDPLHPVKPSQISAACAVADVLGPDVRTHYITRYVALALKEYRRIFKPTDEAGGLDNISRRFAWFRRMLGGHEAGEGKVFPLEWRVDWELFAKFSEITRCVGCGWGNLG